MAEDDSADAFSQIEETWFALRRGYAGAYAKCTTDRQRHDLTADRDGARDAYYLAIRKSFDEADAFVVKTKAQLANANAKLKSALDDMQNIKDTLSAITSAVQLAAALAAMAT